MKKAIRKKCTIIKFGNLRAKIKAAIIPSWFEIVLFFWCYLLVHDSVCGDSVVK